jgi:transposase
MERRKRRKFTTEYKAEVVRLVRASGKSVGQVAKELDLTETAVRAWVRQASIDQGPLTSEERAELARLRREMKTVTMERPCSRPGFGRKSGHFSTGCGGYLIGSSGQRMNTLVAGRT